jgi:stalled ribosome alternative rescue factor ArfA
MIHNPVAKALRTNTFRPQVKKARKGKGSYTRKNKSVRKIEP